MDVYATLILLEAFKLETIQISINGSLVNQNMVYSYNGMLLNDKTK